MTVLLAKVVGPEVRVNAVAPGLVDTPWTADWDVVREVVSQVAPLKRSGQPEDVAEVILALARAGYVTGQVVVIDGGLSLADLSPSQPGGVTIQRSAVDSPRISGRDRGGVDQQIDRAGDGEPELAAGPAGQDADGGRHHEGVDRPLARAPGHAAQQPVAGGLGLRAGVELGPQAQEVALHLGAPSVAPRSPRGPAPPAPPPRSTGRIPRASAAGSRSAATRPGSWRPRPRE